MSHSFEKGDSNRCRNAYERILHAELPMGALNVQKKNKARSAISLILSSAISHARNSPARPPR